ncbi:MAG: sulfite exporter TauE/SafE family protein [Saprospiraceae bacterium]|nr:sulfite exporter TauE/SafE family protein [Saprospiraceae bacterium]
MDFSIYQYILAFLGSFLAGMINTLAGNGSVITLTILTDLLRLDAGVANATNRVGVLFQSLGSATGFVKNNMFQTEKNWVIIISCVFGAVAGVWTVVNTSNEDFLFVFKYMMLVMLVLVLLNPEKWIKEHPSLIKVNLWVQIPLFFFIGFYGGFIQMGVGIFMLVVFVLFSGYTIMMANALKTVIVIIMTTVVLFVFQSNNLIHWEIGLLMAIGQTASGYITARYLSKMKNINVWAYRLLILVIIMAIMSQFQVFSLFNMNQN